MGQSNYVHLEGCRIVHKSEKAFLVEYDGEQIWFPFSQMANPEDYSVGDTDRTVSITEWLAFQKGLDGDD